MEGKDTGKTLSKVKGMSRRELLIWGTVAGAGAVLAGKLPTPAQAQPLCGPSASTPYVLNPFQDALPIPGILTPYRSDTTGDYYKIDAKPCLQFLHKELPGPTPLWGYNGLYPGPTIEATVLRKVYATFKNMLFNTDYMSCIDPMVMGAESYTSNNYIGPLITTHLHGGNVDHNDDGWPDFRYGPGESYTNLYPNIQLPATLWYHDHCMAATRLNVYAGLAAFYILRDALEKSLPLPKGLYQSPGVGFEIPIVIQDRSFNAPVPQPDGSSTVPLWFGSTMPAMPMGNWMAEFFGDYPVVNGKIQPYLEVSRGKYRFRLLNGCNARFLNLSLSPPPADGIHFVQIGTDGGLLPAPVPITPVTVPLPGTSATLSQVLMMAPAERCDVIIDFAKFPAGTTVTVMNDAPGPFPGGVPPLPGSPMSQVMQFKIQSGPAFTSAIPAKLRTMPADPPVNASRFITLVDHGSPMFPNGLTAPDPSPPTTPVNANVPYPTLLINNMRWTEAPTETPKLGSTEVWYWINTAPDTHPMHMHQVQFKVLGRQYFDLNRYLAANPNLGPGNNYMSELAGRDPRPFFTPPAAGGLNNNVVPTLIAPDPNETGWKDTVRCPPGMVTVTVATFGPYKGAFPYHCHIIDHEDNAMMRYMLVTS